MRVGESPYRYEAQADWARLPSGHGWAEVAGIDVDAQDRVYVFSRLENAVFVFEPDGTFVRRWEDVKFDRPHGITIGPDGGVWCSDDRDHTVRKFTPEGRLLLTLGTSGQPSDTGVVGNDYRTIRRAGPPFNYPTNVAFAPSGDLYITDGYGNARVHQFTPEGRLVRSWGEPGDRPGQFNLPHGIAVGPDGTVYVADRENSRVQLFSPEGKFQAEWADVARPCQVAIARGRVYVAELGFRVGRWKGMAPHPADATGGRVSIYTLKGELLARWGGGNDPKAAGDFFAPHDIRVDSSGNVYVAEVIQSAGGGVAPLGSHALQKFTLA